MSAWLKRLGFTVKELADDYATEAKIEEWFDDQTIACKNLYKTKDEEKFLIFCFYSGHGIIKGAGTVHINLLAKEYAFEDKIREFSVYNKKSSYMVGFLHCCR